MTTSTIGTGGTYTTPQAWEDACPANLTTAAQIWRGEMLNQEFVGPSNILTISGTTTNSTYYTELTTAAGASFADHANKANNPLRYNASVGAGIRMTGEYAVAVLVDQPYTKLSNFQISGTSTGANAGALFQVSGTSTNCDINALIVEGFSVDKPVRVGGAGNVMRNCVVIQRRASASTILLELSNGSQTYNTTVVALGGKATYGFSTIYAAGVIKNCYVGGVTNARDAGTTPTMTTNFSDAPATGFASAPLSSATFVSVANDGTHDLRLVAGSALINAGTTEATYAATGILGTPRPQGAAYDIGAWEYTAPATPVTFTGTVPTRNGSVGSAASFANATFFSGTATPFTYSLQSGVLPAGLTLSSSTGVISGTPSAAGTSAGIVVRATDANNATADTNAYSIVITASNAAPTFTGSIANITGTAGTAITQVNVSGQFNDSDTLTYSVSPAGTAWPSGLTINSSTGVISGTVIAAGTTTGLKVRATDTASQTVDSNAFNVTITPSTGSFKTLPLANNTGTLYAAGTSVAAQWHAATRIGSAASTITYTTGNVAADGTVTFTNLPLGPGYLLAAVLGASLSADKPYYQSGTVA